MRFPCFVQRIAFALFVLTLAIVVGCGDIQGREKKSPSGPEVPPVSIITDLNQAFFALREGETVDLPESHKIPSLPPSRQINQLFCVIASTQMLLHYWHLSSEDQLTLARSYAQANPTSEGRKRLAALPDPELNKGEWGELQTNFQGLMRYLDLTFADQGKTFFWEYAGGNDPERHLTALKILVSRNVPVLIAAKTEKIQEGHCMVMFGYTKKSITVLNPTRGKKENIPLAEFMQRFQSLNCEWVTFVPETKRILP